MEMTPGQIMEAEISATLDNLDNPDDLIHNDTSLHDTVFSVASPGPSLDTDFDQVIHTTNTSRWVIQHKNYFNQTLNWVISFSHFKDLNYR